MNLFIIKNLTFKTLLSSLLILLPLYAVNIDAQDAFTPNTVVSKEFLDGLPPSLRGEFEDANSTEKEEELEQLFRADTTLEKNKIILQKLKDQIATLRSNGVNTLKWEVDLHYKLAYSFISLIVIFCGIPLSVFRSNTTLAFGGGLSLATIFAYVIILKFGQSLGYAGVLSPFLGAWLSNLIFVSIGLYLMVNARK